MYPVLLMYVRMMNRTTAYRSPAPPHKEHKRGTDSIDCSDPPQDTCVQSIRCWYTPAKPFWSLATYQSHPGPQLCSLCCVGQGLVQPHRWVLHQLRCVARLSIYRRGLGPTLYSHYTSLLASSRSHTTRRHRLLLPAAALVCPSAQLSSPSTAGRHSIERSCAAVWIADNQQ